MSAGPSCQRAAIGQSLAGSAVVPAPVRAAASAQHGRSYLKRQSATNSVGTDAQERAS